jgi:hypothetical protein
MGRTRYKVGERASCCISRPTATAGCEADAGAKKPHRKMRLSANTSECADGLLKD